MQECREEGKDCKDVELRYAEKLGRVEVVPVTQFMSCMCFVRVNSGKKFKWLFHTQDCFNLFWSTLLD